VIFSIHSTLVLLFTSFSFFFFRLSVRTFHLPPLGDGGRTTLATSPLFSVALLPPFFFQVLIVQKRPHPVPPFPYSSRGPSFPCRSPCLRVPALGLDSSGWRRARARLLISQLSEIFLHFLPSVFFPCCADLISRGHNSLKKGFRSGDLSKLEDSIFSSVSILHGQIGGSLPPCMENFKWSMSVKKEGKSFLWSCACSDLDRWRLFPRSRTRPGSYLRMASGCEGCSRLSSSQFVRRSSQLLPDGRS